MKIGIIGSGNIGGNLTRAFRKAGHDVVVANSRGPESLANLAKETGATPVAVADAVRGNDVVVVTIPQKNIPSLPKTLFADAPASLVVIDTGNYYPQQRDGKIAAIEDGMPESEWVSQQLGVPVVKAFNNIYAAHLLTHGKPAGTPDRVALPIAGDDAHAKAVVTNLIDEIGFDTVDAGTLADSWRQQPGFPGYGTDFDAEKLRHALAETNRERAPEWKA
jgi:predicted dinucleotide-binding enzyme